MLTSHCHGKGQVRVMKLFRSEQRHEVRQFLVETNLVGPVDECFLKGDNSRIVATDTQKNTIFILAKQLNENSKSAECFSMLVAKHFVTTYPEAITECKVTIEEEIWERAIIDGKPHHHGFQKVGPQLGHAFCHAVRNNENKVVVKTLNGGVRGLTLLKTTQSAFENFLRDKFTVLPETKERLLATSVEATWVYLPVAIKECSDFEEVASKIKQTMINAFTGPADIGVASASLQETAFQMGKACVEIVPAIKNISLKLPNIHNIPFDFTAFGMGNKDASGFPDIFWVTKEPFGIIQATVSRPKK